MTRSAWALVALVAASAAHAQPVQSPERISPAAIDRSRVSAAANLSQAVPARWTLANASREAIVMARIAADGADATSDNLLRAPLVTGASIALPRDRQSCAHRIELRFERGGRQTIRQDLCAEPTVRITAPPSPPTAAILPPTVVRPPVEVRPPVAQTLPPAIPAIRPPITDGVPRDQPASANGVGEPPSPPPPAPMPPAAANGNHDAPAPPPLPARPAPDRAPDRAPAGTDSARPPAEDASAALDTGSPAVGADGLIWCEIIGERATPLACRRIENADKGLAGVRAKTEMWVGETQKVVLALSRSADRAALEDELGGPGAIYRTFPVATGRYMEARLTADSGFRIEPDGWVRRDLGQADIDDWEWEVTALTEGRHMVRLRTRVLGREPDGSFTVLRGRESDPQTVDVKIRNLDLATRWLNALTAPFESVTNAVTLLTTLVVALGGLWAAIRTFGRRPKDEGEGHG